MRDVVYNIRHSQERKISTLFVWKLIDDFEFSNFGGNFSVSSFAHLKLKYPGQYGLSQIFLVVNV
jgi:hypothetical protein